MIDPHAPSSSLIRRRLLLRLLVFIPTLALPGSKVGANVAGPSPTPLCEEELRIAALGRRIVERDPELARELLRFTESQLSLRIRLARPAIRVGLARADLLDPQRLGRDFERGEVVRVDGWVLARTEAGVAVYASSLGTRNGPAI